MTYEKYEGLIIYSDDFRSMGYCSRGVRDGFAARNMSYIDFIKNGIAASDLLIACDNDIQVLKVVEAANERRR